MVWFMNKQVKRCVFYGKLGTFRCYVLTPDPLVAMRLGAELVAKELEVTQRWLSSNTRVEVVSLIDSEVDDIGWEKVIVPA